MTSPAPKTIERERLHYSVREWCARNSISRSSFYRLVRAGSVRIVKFGSKTLVPADNRWIRAGTVWHSQASKGQENQGSPGQ